jgi:uncharacterized protein (DUF58 family)
VSPTPRTALALGAIALAGLVVPVPLAAIIGLAFVVTAVVDALAVRRAPDVESTLPQILSRGIASPVHLVAQAPPGAHGDVRVRQAVPPDISVTPSEADFELDGEIVARRRGRHVLPPPATRSEGPLGLGRWYHQGTAEHELLSYPDLPNARRLALAVRQGRFRESGRITRGPLGLGTDFESIREYLPDDDIRQVNWQATARVGRPMSNQYRVEQDRDVMCVVDVGRLMAAPLEDHTRLDVALDAVTAVAAVANVLGDRCGALAFDSKVRRHVSPRRSGGDDVVRALFDLEPSNIDSDYELAFRSVSGSKRSLVLVMTDLLEEAAARPLIEAVPVLSRRHHVIIASAADPDLDAMITTPPTSERDVYSAAVALDVVGARRRVALQLQRSGARVVEAEPKRLGAACVGAYLAAKARARL